ncbi:HDOD domain-containing protein [Thioalkalivibrio sulfidiphilus]|uniref:Putative signal transduction protein n=1 Tax=Thioalkalivibrio sulfidiphilus (strain HL-EbGR7) TaxID=396588 RepID=B8GM73_THISH|nr:HDOD domain-containing protein [Thioalkalivibrio sulfidiphilus]ACL73660.1 putative signal transduction protein [Thioalkalivibrio sulfidiphilus HL-EbGr7]
MFSWFRRKHKPEPEGFTLTAARAQAPESGAAPAAAAVPEDAEIQLRYLARLFRAAVDADAALREDEAAWLRQRDEELRSRHASLLEQVPRLPSLMPRLLAAINDPGKGNARALAALLETDPVFAANVLGVVNGPALRVRREPIESLEQAVVILGLSGMREVIAAAAISPIVNFNRDRRLDGEAVKGLWSQSLDVAMAMRLAASRTGSAHGFALYLAGLTHASGLMALLRGVGSLTAAVPSGAFLSGLESLSRRYTVAIVRHWGLPEHTAHVLSCRTGARCSHPEAAMLEQAVSLMRACVLAQAGLLDQARLAALRQRLPDYAEGWCQGAAHG